MDEKHHLEIFLRKMPRKWDLILEKAERQMRLTVQWIKKRHFVEMNGSPCGEVEMDAHRLDIQMKGAPEVVYAETISLKEYFLRDATDGRMAWKFNGSAIIAPNIVLTCCRESEPIFELGTAVSFRKTVSRDSLKQVLKGYGFVGIFFGNRESEVLENFPALLYAIQYGTYGSPPP